MPPLGWRKASKENWTLVVRRTTRSTNAQSLNTTNSIPVLPVFDVNPFQLLSEDNDEDVPVNTSVMSGSDSDSDFDPTSNSNLELVLDLNLLDKEEQPIRDTNNLRSSLLPIVDYSYKQKHVNRALEYDIGLRNKYYQQPEFGTVIIYTDQLQRNIVDSASVLDNDEFVLLERNDPLRPIQLRLPPRITTLIQIFLLVFTNWILRVIVTNTNAYARTKPKYTGRIKAHIQTPVTVQELQIWLAITILFGVLYVICRREIQRSNIRRQHRALLFIERYRYDQIRRFLYISPPDLDTSSSKQYLKLSPLFSYLRTLFTRFIILPQNVSINEIMAGFTGRSYYTLKAKYI